MVILRTDIERALNEIASQEGGMLFQGLAVVLGKKRWPELIARQRKKDFGLDAYASANLTPERIGKGLAASITPTLKKISNDATTARESFPDLKMLLFVTSAKVGNADRKHWEQEIQKEHGLDLHIIEREEIITQMMMPENASLCASFLRLNIDTGPHVGDLIAKTRRAAGIATQLWAKKTKGHSLIDLTAVRLDPNGAESADVLTLEQIDQALSQSRRIVLEGPAGRGKTTTLIQIAHRTRASGTPFIVDLPAWTSSRRGILDFLAGMPAFQAEGLTAADLARVQQTEPFLLLLNGWNEIAETNSTQADDALRELERDFPSAGIIVATRTHHFTPPLPGALRLRLLRLRRVQRAAYLAARVGQKSAELRARIDADHSLDELTRTPFILSEVASLFEAGADIPSTKIGILAEVLHLQEQRSEHRNALQAAPMFGRQRDYLKALATDMTQRGAVALPDADARVVIAAVARGLVECGQIEFVGAPAVLAALTAHHVLERVEHPQTAFQFEHQQFQEYYSALDARARLLDLSDDDQEMASSFTAEYVNDPVWAEPLRMIAETLPEKTGDFGTDERSARAGQRLVTMTLNVDPVFAGELARLCGQATWNEVRTAVSERLRAIYAIDDGNYQQYALAAMLATGAHDFADIVVPLLSENNQQTRLRTYRSGSDFQVSSIGPEWRERVRGWSEESRADFVSEMLHYRIDGEVANFAAEDQSVAVKKAAASGLMWTGSDDALAAVLDSMDTQTFEDFARKNAGRMPAVLRPKTIAAMRKFVESSSEHSVRLRTALNLAELGEPRLDDVVKDAMSQLPVGDIQRLGSHYIKPALEYLRKTDPPWANEWVATKIAEGALYREDYWLQFATGIPESLVNMYLQRLETEDFKNARLDGAIAVIAARADAKIAARVFGKLRELRHTVNAEPAQQHTFEWQLVNQLEALFRRLPGDVAAAGLLSCITRENAVDIKVAADVLSRVARSDVEPLRIADDNLKEDLRVYLTSSVDLVVRQDDFNGEEKANLASSIAQVGRPEDMTFLVTLIGADIKRVRRGRAARAAGDDGPLGHGGSVSYAGWHIAAVMNLDAAGAGQVLVNLLSEPEYLSDVAVAMARDFLPKQERSFDRTFRYDLMWAAREGRIRLSAEDQRRIRFAAALNAEIQRLRNQNQDGNPPADLKQLAMALAAVDGRDSAAAVIEAIAMPGQWDQYTCLDAAERLLIAGVVLPTTAAFTLLDSILERTGKWMQDSDRYLLIRALSLCPFVDDPAAGIARIRDEVGKRRLRGYELGDLITAVGESRCDAAVELLCELASDAQIFEQCEDNFISAIAALDTHCTTELLLSFVDPAIRGVPFTRRPHREDMLVALLTESARRRPATAARLQNLCERDLPELNRHLLSKVMGRLGTADAFAANLNLLDDTKPSPIPQGVWDQIDSAFVERRPYAQKSNVFTEHARASNELRVRLFKMALDDQRRRKSAFTLLGKVEILRLEHGKPTGEPRHPELTSGLSWPLKKP